MRKRVFSILLALCMVASLVSVPALAAEEEATSESVVEVIETETTPGGVEGDAGRGGGTATCTAEAVCSVCNTAYGEKAVTDRRPPFCAKNRPRHEGRER